MNRILLRTSKQRRRRARKLLQHLWNRRDELAGREVRVFHDPAQTRLAIVWNSTDSSGDWVNAVAATQAELTTGLGYTVRVWTLDDWAARLFALTTTGDPNDIPPAQFPILPD
jgi:hypothetical protein